MLALDKETYVGEATCRTRRVIRFYYFKAAALLAAAAAALTVRESGRRMQQRYRRTHWRTCDSLCLLPCRLHTSLSVHVFMCARFYDSFI